MDLVLRKVARDKGECASALLSDLTRETTTFLPQAGLSDCDDLVETAFKGLAASTAWIVAQGPRQAPALQAVSVPYLELWGLVLAASLLIRAGGSEQDRSAIARIFLRHRLVYAPALATIVQTCSSGILDEGIVL